MAAADFAHSIDRNRRLALAGLWNMQTNSSKLDSSSATNYGDNLSIVRDSIEDFG
jgi:hypothetical protein